LHIPARLNVSGKSLNYELKTQRKSTVDRGSLVSGSTM